MHLRVVIKKRDKEESKNYDLYPDDASLQNISVRDAYWEIRCHTCTEKSELIAKLLQRLIADHQEK